MALTVEELNIIINAVFKDDGAIEELRGQIKKVVDEYKKQENAAKETADRTAAAHAAMAAVAVKSFDYICQAVGRGIAAYNEYESAVKGLNSIAIGKDIDQSGLKAALDEVTDAMFDATAAAASFKNLLSRGYSLDQATNTIKRLKDAAAFGRQANLQLADAVKTATEGLKAENSILVDNAGVQKNVAKMWQDYAKARGITTESMTQAQKVEAEYLGIMEETALQVGDYEKSLNTLAGTQAEAANSINLLAKSYGESMSPAVQIATEAVTDFTNGVRNIIETCPNATAGVTATLAAFAGFVAIQKAAKALKTFTAGLSALSGGPVMWGLVAIAGSIGVITAAITNVQRKEQAAAEAAREHTEQLAREYSDAQKLASEYQTLANKASLTADEKTRLAEIEQTLIDNKDSVVGGIDAETQAYEDNTQAVKDNAEAKATAQTEALLKAQAEAAKETLLAEQWKSIEESVKNANKGFISNSDKISDLREIYEQAYEANRDVMERGFKKEKLNYWELAKYNSVTTAYNNYQAALNTQWDAIIESTADYVKTKFDDVMGESDLQNSLSQSLSELFTHAVKDGGFDPNSIDFTEFTQSFISAFENADLSQIEASFKEKTAGMFTADGFLKVESQEAYQQAIADTRAETDLFIESIVAMASTVIDSDAELASFRLSLQLYADKMLGIEPTVRQLANGMTETTRSTKTNEQAAKDATDAVADQAKELINLEKATKRAATEQDNLAKKQKLVERSAELTKHRQYFETLMKGEKTTKEYAEAQEALAKEYGKASIASTESLLALGHRITLEQDAVTSSIDAINAQGEAARIELNDTRLRLLAIRAQEGASPILDSVILQTRLAIGYLDQMLSLTAKGAGKEIEVPPPKGGGGKSKKEREAEEARRAAEEAKRAQEEEYRKALERIDHLKTLDQLTAEQEIDMLLEVQRVHAKTAEQRMEMEEKLYTARKELAEKRYSDALDEIDHLMALDQMSAEQELARLIEIQAQYATTEEQRREMAEKVYAAQKALQQQAYDDALAGIDRKTRMDQISAEEEIALLEEVARVHAQTAEQRLDIEERLYAARKALAEQQYSDALSEIEHMLRMDEIGAEEELTMLEDVEAQYAKTAEQKREMEERIYQARKQLQEDAFNDELGRIDRLKSRNEISTQEQIEQLERVAQTHAQTAEQREKIEDKLYQAQQALRKEEEGSINRLNSGIINALKARYEEQRDAEVERLNESKEAWKDWSDETCKSIQAQIDALDEQAEAENREKTDADNLRAIDKAKQALLYETDEYNRKQLEKQIAELEEKRAEQLKQWERADLKEALRDEMEAVKEKAKAEQEAIQSEIDRVKDLYAERLKAASLQAEAERLLMKSNQEEILDLIGSYAPDYEATGKTLGERLYEGLTSTMGGIADWYASLVAGIEQMQANIAQNALDAVDRLHAGQYAGQANRPGAAAGGLTVNQYMTFETPVESPADTAWKVKQMGYKLADML